MQLSARDEQRLQGVHPDLVRVVRRAAVDMPADMEFVVLEGLRTIDRQRQLLAKGATTTMRSRHLTGHAVDIAPYLDTDGDGTKEISWHWPHYFRLAGAMKSAALAEGVQVEWGGDWREFKDGPHWQLPWRTYPA
ncbi:MAG: M15 family metallopeptidase [Proteobacteria bacterium]|nr:M15 family metallopeptidase [Pseudomonadota bacterium]